MSVPDGTITQEAPGLWRIALPRTDNFVPSVNAYVLEDDGGVALVDTGENTPDNRDVLFAALAQLGVDLASVRNVYLTHAHHDHFGLSTRLAEHGATLWAHPADIEYLRRRFVEADQYQHLFHAWMLAHGATQEEADGMVEGFSATYRIYDIPPAQPLAGDAPLRIGQYRFATLWTPGHTPGHLCLLEEEQRMVLCGDHVLERVATHVGMQPYTDQNPLPHYLASLERLASPDLGLRLALPGHGEAFTSVRERAQRLLDHQRARRESVLEALAQGPRTAVELARLLWADTRPYNWATFRPYLRRNATAQVIAHLELLRAEQSVARTDEAPYRYALQAVR